MSAPTRPQRIPGPLSVDFLISRAVTHLAYERGEMARHGRLRPAARPPALPPSVQIIDDAVADVKLYSTSLDPAELELARVAALDELRSRTHEHSRFMSVLSPGAFECWAAAYATCIIISPAGHSVLEAADGSVVHGSHYRWPGQAYELDRVSASALPGGRGNSRSYAWPDGQAPSAQERLAYGLFRAKGEPISAALDLAREVVTPRRLSSAPQPGSHAPDLPGLQGS